VITIQSPGNPRVKMARKLQRRRHRDEQGLCLLEGSRLVLDAWQADAAFHTLFLTPAAAQADPALGHMAEAVQSAGAELLWVTEEVVAALSETVTPQGVVAVVGQNQQPLPVQRSLVLILDGVGDPGNGGTLLRSATAAGVDLVLFGPGSVDAYNQKCLRAGMGAHFRLPLRQCATWEGVMALLGDLPLFVADAQADLAYDQVDWQQPAGLILGNEANGPSPAARHASHPIAIPMPGAMESLNVAIAGSVILFEAARQRRAFRGA
jgi:TrmH family RNA methyltransferase